MSIYNSDTNIVIKNNAFEGLTRVKEIQLSLHGHVVIIEGNSGTGKTLIFNVIKQLGDLELADSLIDGISVSDIQLVLDERDYSDFKSSVESKGLASNIKLVIIDECDQHGLFKDTRLKKCIEGDLSRHYLLMMRTLNTGIKYGDCLGTTPANIAELEESNGIFRLVYTYDIGGR